MTVHRIVALLAVCGGACSASAQTILEIRFPNGTNVQAFAPNSAVPVRLWATGLPNVGTPMNWTTPPGTGQVGTYQGFIGVRTNLHADAIYWTQPTIAPPFVGPPFGNPGVVFNPNVYGITISVGLNPPVTGNSMLLWTGTGTIGFTNCHFYTQIEPVGNPPQTGFEVAIDVGLGYLVSHFLPAQNGTALIPTGTWPPVCYPDCNKDYVLNLADFGCFQTRYLLWGTYADCNGDLVLNLADFGCFQSKFALGCP